MHMCIMLLSSCNRLPLFLGVGYERFSNVWIKKKKQSERGEREANKGLRGEKKGGRGEAMWQMITMNLK